MSTLDSFTISRHAVTRALEMGMEPSFIQRLLGNPATRRRNESAAHGAAWIHTLEGFAAVVADDGAVLTFLFTRDGKWSRD